jgi:hypothetical protein
MAPTLYSLSGVFNCDPHPGNLLVSYESEIGPVPVLLDWGMTKRLAPAERAAFCLMVRCSPQLTVHSSLVTAHCFTAHCSQLTIHSSVFTARELAAFCLMLRCNSRSTINRLCVSHIVPDHILTPDPFPPLPSGT